MPGTGKYGTVVADKTRKFGYGSADQTAMTKVFAQSVMTTLSFKDLVDLAKKYLTADTSGGNQDGDTTIWGGPVNLNFSGAPDIAKTGEIKTGGGGLPSTAYSPNLNSPATSPAGGTINPADQTAMDPIAVPQPTYGDGAGIGGRASPATSAAEVSSTELGKTLTLGKHPGSK